MKPLEQDTTRKRQVDEKGKRIKFELSNEKKFKFKEISDNAVYIKELQEGHLIRLYYLISWKNYHKKKNI